MSEFLDAFKRRHKKLKRVRFQIPGTKSNGQRNNLARHLKSFPADVVAAIAFASVGGGTITEASLF